MAITRARTSSVAQGPSTRKTVLGGNDVILGGSYDAIGVVDVGSTSVASIEFTSIPQGYKHLQIRVLQMTSGTTNPKFRVNGDSASNYNMHSIYNTNPGAAAYVEATTGISYCYNETTAPGVSIIDLLDYSNTSKNKTFRMMTGYDNNGAGYLFYRSGLWRSTNAVTSLTFNADSSNFLQYSQFALYGVK